VTFLFTPLAVRFPMPISDFTTCLAASGFHLLELGLQRSGEFTLVNHSGRTCYRTLGVVKIWNMSSVLGSFHSADVTWLTSPHDYGPGAFQVNRPSPTLERGRLKAGG
jgi:hypothetical protein